ncbi:MAG: hypothetical protein KAV87_40700 [Desulfobacteraceae bacterium]|nr:hypothetical protein [Desulfobacteraceae bacterium]
MKVRLLPFAITGLLSGGVCWWLANLPVEFLMGETFVATYYPGIVLAIALLALSKMLGNMGSGQGVSGPINLFVSAILAQIFIVGYHTHLYDSALGQWDLGLYPLMYIEGEPFIFDGFPILLLPTPISSAIQAAVIAFGVACAWDLKGSARRIVVRAAVAGALFAGLTILLTHLFSLIATDPINEALSRAADQTGYAEMWALLYQVLPVITLLLWHSFLLLAIYVAIRPQTITAVSADEIAGNLQQSVVSDGYVSDEEEDKLQSAAGANIFASIDKAPDAVKQAAQVSNWLSTPEIIATLRARKRTVRQFFWILLVIALLIVNGATAFYRNKTTETFNSMIVAHKQLMQKYAEEHPLYGLWPELKACGGGLRGMKGLLWSADIEPESKECEFQVQDRLARELENWGESLNEAALNQPFSIRSELLLQSNSPEHPSYSFFSAVRECGNQDRLTEVLETMERNEPLTGDQLYFVDCLKEKNTRIQKSLEGYTESLPESSSESMLKEQGVRMVYGPDYAHFSPPSWSSIYQGEVYWDTSQGNFETFKTEAPTRVSRSSYWSDYRVDDYRYGNYPPTGSFQEALNRAWQFGEVIQPIEKPGEQSFYFHNGELQLLTPIVIGGETQAIILSELETRESGQIDENIASEWRNCRSIIIITLVIMVVLFCWYEYRTLRRIPKEMDLSQWQAGIWRPSLSTLYQVDGFRYYHFVSMMAFSIIFPIIIIFIPVQELTWSELLLSALAVMALPLIFGLIVIPKMVVDYRLFAKGVPVPCKKVGSKTEELTAGSMHHTNTEYHDRHHYEAHYEGKLYKFWAPAGNIDDQAIALINPDQPKQCLLLNAFCKNYGAGVE